MGTSATWSVRRIRVGEGPVLRSLRMAALSSDPLAFGSTLEVEEAHPLSLWEDRARAGADSDTDAIFFVTERARPPHGMLGAFTHEGSRYLWGMWVAPERRGEGAGEALLGSVLAWCHDHPAENPVRLDVNPTQVAALRLYERHGFRPDGALRPLGHHPPAMRQAMRLVERDSSRRPIPGSP
jgi:GNAT superfamily N-acetyltransferase